MELNLETLKPEIEPSNEYVPERRMPMRNPPACIQYWVDTGKPPCKAYADENYNSDSGSSLSETEILAPLPAPSPPLKCTLPHPPQLVDIPTEKIQRIPSVISSSSVNTREYILSATQFISRKVNLANMENIMDYEKVPEALLNIEDAYVDVCGTDELPKITEEANQNNSEPSCVISQNIRDANSMPTCQINDLEGTLILGEMFNKNLSDKSAIMRVATGSLKIGDVIPSLQRIRDGPENFNAIDLYSNNLPSEKSEDLIESSRNNSPPKTPFPEIEEPVIPMRDLNRRKLFTNPDSPIDLIQPSTHCPRRVSSNTNLHPALTQFDVIQNQSKTNFRRKKSLFRPKKKLLQIVEKETEEKVRGNQQKEVKENEDEINPCNLKNKEEIQEVNEDIRLKRKPIVKLERTSESFIQKQCRRSGFEKKIGKRISFKAKSTKKGKKKDKGKKLSSITEKELKLQDLIVSLERLPRVVLERLVQANKSEKGSIETTLTKDTLSETSSAVSDKNNLIGLKSSNVNKSLKKSKKKVSIFVESADEEDEVQTQNLIKKCSPVKNSYTKKIISLSSDEEDFFKIDKEDLQNPKGLLKNQDSNDERVKENCVSSGTKIGPYLTPKVNNKTQNSPFKSNKRDQTITLSSNKKDQTMILRSKNKDKTSTLEFNNVEQNSPLKISDKLRHSSPKLLNTNQNSSLKCKKEDLTNCAQTLPLKLNTKSEIPQKSMKVIFTLSSDEDDDFTKIIEKSFSATKSRNKKKLSKTCNNVRQSRESLPYKIRSSCGAFSGHNVYINECKMNDSTNKAAKTAEIFEKPEFDVKQKKVVNDATLNNLSVNVETKIFEDCDNNLKEKSSTDNKVKSNKTRKESANYKEYKLNPCESMDTRGMSRLILVSSGDSSDSDNNTSLIRKKTKRLQRKSSKPESTNSRRSSKKNLRVSAKIASEKRILETLEEENSDSSDNSRKLLKNQQAPPIKSEKQNLEKKRINESETSKRIEIKKPLIFVRDSDSESSFELFDTLPKPNVSGELKEKTKDKNSSKIKTSPKKLQNNHFGKSNLHTAKEIAKPLGRFSKFNSKRKRPGFSGSISSDSEDSQSDLEFKERHRVKKIGTFENGENVIRILQQSKRIRRDVKESIFDSSLNIFGDDQSRDSSLNIFGSSNESSDIENILHLKFKNRLKNRKGNQNFLKNAGSGIKLEIFRTKSYWESDSD